MLSWAGLAAGANVGAGILTAQALSVSDRGVLAIVLSVSGLASVVGGLGTNVAIRHLLPRPDPQVSFGDYLGLSALLAAGVAAIATAAILLGGRIIDRQMLHLPIVVAGTVYAVGFFLSIQCFDGLNAFGRTGAAAGVNAAGSVLVLLLVIGASIARAGLALILCAYSLAVLFQTGFALRLLQRGGAGLRPRLRAEPSARLVRLGAPAVALNLGQVLAYRLDRYLIGAIAGPAVAGVYSVATTPAELLRIPATAYGQVTLHGVASGEFRVADVWHAIRRTYLLVIAPAAALAIAAPWLIETVFGERYTGATTPFRILVLAELFLLPFQIAARALSGLGRTREAAVAGFLGLAVTVTALLLLVPQLGAAGGALASVGAYAVMSGVSVALLRRHWK